MQSSDMCEIWESKMLRKEIYSDSFATIRVWGLGTSSRYLPFTKDNLLINSESNVHCVLAMLMQIVLAILVVVSFSSSSELHWWFRQ